MSGVEVLLQVLVLAAAGSLILARWPRLLGLWWVIVAGVLMAALWTLPLTGPVLILGRHIQLEAPLTWGRFTLHLDASAREAIRMMLILVGLWGVAATLIPGWGRGLEWMGLALLGAALAVTTTATWAWGWALAVWATTTLVLAFGGMPTRGRPVWPWFLPWTLPALGLFALLVWPDPNRATLEPWRVHLLALAFIVWSGLVPIHVGHIALTSRARPLGATWAWWTHTLILLTLAQRTGFSPGWDEALWRAAPVLQFLGIVSLFWAGLAALSARDMGRLTAHAALYNWALVFTMWGTMPRDDALIRWTLTTRFLALNAAGLGIAALLRDRDIQPPLVPSGWARRRPWSVALWALGIATMSGAPFTPGVWTQWMVHRLGGDLSALTWATLVGGLGVMGGLIRALVTLWGPLDDPFLVREEGLPRGILWAMTVGFVLLALSPRTLAALSTWLW